MSATEQQSPVSRRRPSSDVCATCGRKTLLTFHHLIPRKLHRRTRFRRHYTSEALNRGIQLCRPCHSAIHRRYDEMTLARDFSTLERLLTDEMLRRHFAWVARQKC
jgi:5-methylcytosine-specific restriction endonuclease McrA